eukprot:6139618-Amphidinium_carterae.1
MRARSVHFCPETGEAVQSPINGLSTMNKGLKAFVSLKLSAATHIRQTPSMHSYCVAQATREGLVHVHESDMTHLTHGFSCTLAPHILHISRMVAEHAERMMRTKWSKAGLRTHFYNFYKKDLQDRDYSGTSSAA